jgi:signal transduction histidine kinase
MRWGTTQKASAGIVAALTIVITVDAASYGSFTGLIRSARAVIQHHEVIDELDWILLRLQDAETGQRGYIITGQERYLQPYRDAAKAIPLQIARLRPAVDAGPLELLVLAKLAELEETVDIRRREGFEAAQEIVLTDRGKRIMDDLRTTIADLRTASRGSLDRHNQEVEARARRTIAIIGTGSLVGLAFLAVAGVIIRRDFRARWIAAEERARLEASLRRRDRMSAMGALVAGVAHEVRNPLFAISSTLDALEARLGAPPEIERHLSVVRAELDRLRRLMRDLLQYGRPPRPAHSSAPVEDVVIGALKQCRPLAERSGVALATRVDRPGARVWIDREQMQQAYLNVIENAIQFSPPGEAVRVTIDEVREAGLAWVECRVEDAGPGFKAEDLPRVPEPFFSQRPGGTGLGLSIVQRIVEHHGGRMLVGNRDGGGAVVALRLPVAEGPRAPGTEGERADGETQNPRR